MFRKKRIEGTSHRDIIVGTTKCFVINDKKSVRSFFICLQSHAIVSWLIWQRFLSCFANTYLLSQNVSTKRVNFYINSTYTMSQHLSFNIIIWNAFYRIVDLGISDTMHDIHSKHWYIYNAAQGIYSVNHIS